ncbi:hypothetical protein Tco_0210720 [Tanacetum coccineum]
MTGQRSQLINFVSKFMGTIRFRNDHVAAIRGYRLFVLSKLSFYFNELPTNVLTEASQIKVSERSLVLCSFFRKKARNRPTNPIPDDSIQEKLYLLHMDLCGPMRIESINGKSNLCVSPVPTAAASRPADPTGSPLLTSIDQAAPSTSTSLTIQETQSLVIYEGVEEQSQPAHFVDDPFLDILTSEPSSQESSSNVQPTNPPLEHISKWKKIHPLEIVISNPSRPVST